MPDKYTIAGIRQRTERKGNPWQGRLRYSVPNPNYLPPPESGKDERTAAQKRTVAYRELTKLFPADVRTKRQAEKACEEWRQEMEREAEREAMPSANISVPDYVYAFIDTLEASGNVERTTIHGYRQSARSIEAAFKDVKLADLDRSMIQRWENGLSKAGYSPSTVIKRHRLLSQVCKDAVNNDELPKNPCGGVRLPKAVPPSPNAMTAENAARLAYTLSQMDCSPVAVGATIALFAGLREGEVCGLRWRCYDRERGTIRVEESIGNDGGRAYSKVPKTKRSKREIPVPKQLAVALEHRRRAMMKELEEVGLSYDEAEFGALYVIGYIDGRYHNPTILGKGWHVLSHSFGLVGTQGRPVTFHDLRHTFISLAIANGVDVSTVAALAGHSNTSMTLDVYADAFEESKRAAADIMGKALKAGGGMEAYPVAVGHAGS